MPGNERPNTLPLLTADDVRDGRFFRLPKELILSERYEELSDKAILLYAVLRDRADLSLKNGWIDKDGYVYLIAPVKEMAQIFRISDVAIKNKFAELKEAGLIKSVRRGIGLPNIIYLAKVCGEGEFTTGVEQSYPDGKDNFAKEVNYTSPIYKNETKKNDTNWSETDGTVGGSGEPAPEKEPRGKKKPPTRSLIPTLDEVKAHAAEKGISEDTAEAFFDYWESMGWKRRGSPLVKWKAAFATWVRNDEKWNKEKAPARLTEQEKYEQERKARDEMWDREIREISEMQDRYFAEADKEEREREERRRRSEAAEKWNEAIKGWHGDLKMKMMGG